MLCTQWGDYGSRPRQASFAMHAAVIKHYRQGAWYPIGGGACVARGLVRTDDAAGGTARTRAPLAAIRVAQQRVSGVTLDAGTRIDCRRRVISDIGVHNMLRSLPSGKVDDA